MKKKIASIVLIIAMMLNGMVLAASNSVEVDYYEEALFDITSLGIFIPDDEGGYRTEDKLTRAEFATVILRVMGYDETTTAYTGTFPDVAEDAWYMSAVETVASNGIMVGDDTGYFRPEDYVSYEEAVVTLVRTLGYGKNAETLGGYPYGHLEQARKLDLLEGLDMGEDFLRGDLAVIVYNAIDTPLMVKNYGSADEYFISDGTYRDLLMGERNGGSMYKVNGIVMATPYSYIDFPIAGLENDEVVIGSGTFNVGSTDAAKYLGMEVDAFCRKDAKGKLTLVSVRATENNVVYELKADEVISYDGNFVEYEKENGKTAKINVEGCTTLKNGLPVERPGSSTYDIKNGSVKIIDNDNNKVGDIVLIETYENALVSGVSNNVIRFYDGFTVAGDNLLNVDYDDLELKFEIYDKDGNSAKVEDIKKDSLISVYVDESKTRFRIYISNEMVSGPYSYSVDGYIGIGEEKYPKSDSAVIKANLGEEVEAYLDYKGEIGVIKKTESQAVYGYIIGANTEKLGKGQLRVLVGKKVSFSADVNDENADNVTSTPVLICENEKIDVYEIDNNVNVDGERVSSAEVAANADKYKAVKLTVTPEGVLKKIETLEMKGGHETQSLKYDVYDKIFAGDQFIEPIAINETSKIICLPETVNVVDDYLVRTRIDVAGNKIGYLVQGYDYDELTKTCGLIVVTKGMDSTLINTANEKSSKYSMVLENEEILDEEGDIVHNLVLLEGSQETTYKTVKIKDANSLIRELDKGDLITYIINDSDLIENVMLIHSFGDEEEGSYSDQHPNRDYIEYCGVVNDILRFEIDRLQIKKSAEIMLDIYGASTGIYVPERNTPPVYIYDYSRKGEVKAATLDDITPGDDKVYIVSISGKTPRACVIIRGE